MGEGQTNAPYRQSLSMEFIEIKGMERKERERERERETAMSERMAERKREGSRQNLSLKGTFPPPHRLGPWADQGSAWVHPARWRGRPA